MSQFYTVFQNNLFLLKEVMKFYISSLAQCEEKRVSANI